MNTTAAGSLHDEIVTIDGQSPLLIETHDEQYIDWYKQGGTTAWAVSVSFGPMGAVSTFTDKMQTLDQMSFMHKLFHKRDDLILVRTAADILRAKQEGKSGIILDFQNATAVECEKTALDAIECSEHPVIISHANSRNKFDRPRNVPDQRHQGNCPEWRCCRSSDVSLLCGRGAASHAR